ncbi:fatty acid-binding protein 10-A, liver basic-like [Styela clava]
MSLSGKFKMVKRDNYEKFAGASGATDEQIKRGSETTLETEVTQDGDNITVKRIYPNQTVSNTFQLGVPNDFNFPDGRNAKATCTKDGEKIVLKGENFSQISEIEDGKLKETLTLKGVSMVRWSDRC